MRTELNIGNIYINNFECVISFDYNETLAWNHSHIFVNLMRDFKLSLGNKNASSSNFVFTKYLVMQLTVRGY